MGCAPSRISWSVYWRYGPVDSKPLMTPLAVMSGIGEGMGPDGYWPSCTLECTDSDGQPAKAPKEGGPLAARDDLVIRVIDRGGQLLQELPLANVAAVLKHSVAPVSAGSVSKPGWTHLVFEPVPGSAGLYVNGRTASARALLNLLCAVPSLSLMDVPEERLFAIARQARLPIGPPGETEFKPAALHFGTRVQHNPVRPPGGGLTVVHVGEVSAPRAPGAGSDDTRFFDLRNGPPPGLAHVVGEGGGGGGGIAESKGARSGAAAVAQATTVDDTPAATSLRASLLNRRVRSRNLASGRELRGVCRFVGDVTFPGGGDVRLMVGVEVEEGMGAHDGTVHHVSYFRCPPKSGIMLPADKVELDEPQSGEP